MVGRREEGEWEEVAAKQTPFTDIVTDKAVGGFGDSIFSLKHSQEKRIPG